MKKKKGGYDYDLIVIGGGSAAFSAALRAHELGGRSLILNAGLPTGGTCVNVGCVPSKFLLRAAESVHRAGHIPFEGIRPHAPQVDFGALIRQKKALVDEMRQRKYLEVVQGVENIDIRNGYASFVDAHTVSTEQGETFTAGHVLIATGASTHIPDIPGLEQVDYLTNESLFEQETLPGELLILGAGYIGLEIAQAYSRLGAKVTVLQRSSHILSSQQADISDALAAYLKAEGIAIHTGLKFEQVQRQG
ncbi:MAG: mercury(II) reductase, partial [Bacteroidetes bacterium]